MRGTIFLGPIVFLGCLVADHAVAQQRPSGEAIFRHHWSPGDSRSPSGDGLGPLFNGRSCIQCHDQGGIGGGGGIEQNIDFLTNQTSSLQGIQKLVDFHPGFLNEDGLPRTSIILHRFGPDHAYSRKRTELTGVDISDGPENINPRHALRAVQLQPVQLIRVGQRVHLSRSQRNSTALFGAGLINQIPDDVILQGALRSPTGRPAVVGGAGKDEPLRLGRFGWRGQTATIEEFVMDACAMELGLEVHAREQTPDPRDPDYRPDGVDLTAGELHALTRFVKSLPRPRQFLPDDGVAKKRVAQGESTFRTIGCANCHVEQLGNVNQLYSDLLLHDLGTHLADPVMATRPVPLPEIIANLASDAVPIPQRSSGSYGGGSRPVFASVANANLAQEWRTPPLWGVADSAPYMHDGRAATLVEAITLHGGDALSATIAFLDLPLEERMNVVEFLQTLRASPRR